MSGRRSWKFKALLLWMWWLGGVGIWRGWTLWQERRLLFELDSALVPATLVVFVALSILVGLALWASVIGLWRRYGWARRAARVAIPVYFVLIQTYTWLFVRSGLMWQRRWVSLALAFLGVSIALFFFR